MVVRLGSISSELVECCLAEASAHLLSCAFSISLPWPLSLYFPFAMYVKATQPPQWQVHLMKGVASAMLLVAVRARACLGGGGAHTKLCCMHRHAPAL